MDEYRLYILAEQLDVNGRFVGWGGVYEHFVLTPGDYTVLKKRKASVDMWERDVTDVLFTRLTKYIKTIHIRLKQF